MSIATILADPARRNVAVLAVAQALLPAIASSYRTAPERTVLLIRRGQPPRVGQWSLPGGAQHLGETLAEIASIDLLFAVLDRIVSEAGRSMSSFIGADEAKIAMWQNQVNVVRQALADRQANTHLKVNAVLQIIEKTAFIENVLAASMSPGMAASLDWSRGVQSRALTH